MSIKRRMRRLNAEGEKPPEPVPKAAAKGKAAAKPPEEEKDTKDTGLPERQWQGIPKYELRALFLGDSWPEDPILADCDVDEKKKELTDTLKSFRSYEAQRSSDFSCHQRHSCDRMAAKACPPSDHRRPEPGSFCRGVH